MRLAPLIAGILLLVSGEHTAMAQRADATTWGRVPPHVAEALHAFRQSDHWLAGELARNEDDDQQGRDNGVGRPLNFDPATHLLYIQRDLNGDGRSEVFLLIAMSSLFGNSVNIPGVLMAQDATDGWRTACEVIDAGTDRPDGNDTIALPGSRSRGWQDFRTSEGLYRWRASGKKPGQSSCFTASHPRYRSRSPGERLPWDSIPAASADALHAFRQMPDPVADSMARNLDGDRQGLDHPDGTPARNFDASRHLLFLERDLNGDGVPEAILLFAWPPLATARSFPGVVMQQRGQDGSWRLACRFHDAGDTAPGQGPRLLPARSNGWRDIALTGGTYHWQAAPDGASPGTGPACVAPGSP